MRYTILGFNQAMLVKYGINMNEVLLLDYIYNAVASPTMIHKIENNISYVWLNHKKVLEDLPILDISEDRLKRLLHHLLELGLINSVRDISGRGSKSYYCITKECEELRYSNYEVLKTTLHNDDRSVKNNTSDNKLLNLDNLDNTITINSNSTTSHNNFEFGKKKETKRKKPNMYDNCIGLINEFTDDEILRSMLVESLQLFLNNSCESNRPLYTNNFKGKLNQLKALSTDNYEQRKIVSQTLKNGWNGFYAVKTSSSGKNKFSEFDGMRSDRYDDDYVQDNDRKIAEREKNGQRTKF